MKCFSMKQELKNSIIIVAITIVLIVTLYVFDGVNAVSKAYRLAFILIPLLVIDLLLLFFLSRNKVRVLIVYNIALILLYVIRLILDQI